MIVGIASDARMRASDVSSRTAVDRLELVANRRFAIRKKTRVGERG
jgi:hypothetical protein